MPGRREAIKTFIFYSKARKLSSLNNDYRSIVYSKKTKKYFISPTPRIKQLKGENFSISAILFDLGGTLIDEASNVLNTEKGYYEIQVKAIYNSLENDGISVDWTLFKDKYEEVRIKQKEKSKQTLIEYDMCQRITDTLNFFNYNVSSTSHIIRSAVDAYFKIFFNILKIQQSTHNVFKTLADTYKLGVVTNFAYSPGAHRILDRIALRPFFKAVVISGEIGWKKPSQHIFKFALSKLSSKPEEAIFVGDDYEADIVGAKNVGMKTVFLSKESNNYQKADIIIESLEELPSAIKQIITR